MRSDQAWVLIFNAGQQNEGVYTLQGRTAYVLAFERTDDAERFAQLLQADGFDEPTCAPPAFAWFFIRPAAHPSPRLAAHPEPIGPVPRRPLCWDSNQLSAFCAAGEFEMSLVPQGSLVTPPSTNEYDNDAFDRLQAASMLGSLLGLGDEEAATEPAVDGYASERAALERLFTGDEEP